MVQKSGRRETLWVRVLSVRTLDIFGHVYYM
jgi:hypothetical protein